LTRLFIFIILAVLTGYYIYPEPPLPQGTKIDALVVIKSGRELQAYSEGRLVKTYKISLGDPTGPKTREGDRRTPEGHYLIRDKNPESGYHKNLGISYPDEADRAAALQAGNSPGGDIKIHGLRNGLGFIEKFHRWYDWTNGCIAVTNAEIDELYEAVGVGTKIEIRP
jgi:murein L,D-transpeptidase YafK